MIGGHVDREDDGRAAAHHVLQGCERQALAAQLRLGRVRLGLQVHAGMHHHAELGAQERQRQQVYEPAAMSTNQDGLRGRSIRATSLPDNLNRRKVVSS